MSEESLPSFGPFRLRSFRVSRIRDRLGRIFRRIRRPRHVRDGAFDRELRTRAASVIEEYAETHAALLDRALRLGERAERLEREGTPSESARNRAERARREVEAGLAVLRSTFVAGSGEPDGRPAFDREIEARYPALRLFAEHS